MMLAANQNSVCTSASTTLRAISYFAAHQYMNDTDR